jgi:hypothetical protein
MSAKTVAKEAIRLLNRNGWFQMGMQRTDDSWGTECLYLAVCHAAKHGYDGDSYYEERDATLAELRRVIGFPEVPPEAPGFQQDLIAWNDARGRTRAEVYEALRRVAVS